MRSLLGGALLLALTFASGGLRGVSAHRRDLMFVVASGAAMAANWLFLYEAYQQIEVGAATLLCYCGPVIVMAVSPLIFRERLTLWKVAGFAIVVVGAFLVIGGTGTTYSVTRSQTLPVQTVAVCGYLEPLSAVVMSALILGEQMTVPQIIGAACVIGGALLAELKK